MCQGMHSSECIRDLEIKKFSLPPDEIEDNKQALDAAIRFEVAIMDSLLDEIRNRNRFTVTNFEEFGFLQQCTTSEIGVRIGYGTTRSDMDLIYSNLEEGRECIVEEV